MGDVVAIGALRLDGTPCGLHYRPRSIPTPVAEKFVMLAERDGLIIDCSDLACDHTLVLDLIDQSGDIVDDRCVVNEAAWLSLNSELALRPNGDPS